MYLKISCTENSIDINELVFLLLKFFALISLIYIPLSGFSFVLDSISGDSTRIIRRLGENRNLIFSLLRDLFSFITIILFFIHILFEKNHIKIKSHLSLLNFLAFSFISFSALYSIIINPIVVFFAGLRIFQYFFTFLIFLYLTYKDKKIIKKYEQIVMIIFIIEFIVSILQTQFMIPYEGETLFGSRVIGTFNNPNTIGSLFAFFVMFFLYFQNLTKSTSFLFVTVALIGVLATGSRAAILCSFFLIILRLWQKINNVGVKLLFMLMASVLFFGIYHLLPKLSGRGMIMKIEDDPRWQILFDVFNKSSLSEFITGHGLGYASNTLNSLLTTFPKIFHIGKNLSLLTDSTIAIIILQFGIFGFFFYLLFLSSISLILRVQGFAVFLYLMTIGVSNVWFEMYPINLLICSLLGIYIAAKSQPFDVKI